MANINVKGTAAKPDLLSSTGPEAGDIVSKLRRYLTDKRGVSKERAAKLLADAIDDYLEEEPSSTDEVSDLLDELRKSGVAGKTPEQIAESLAQLLDGGGPRGNVQRLEKFLRARVDERLEEGGAGA